MKVWRGGQEVTLSGTVAAEEGVRILLANLLDGNVPDDLALTPARWVLAMLELTEGYRQDPATILSKTFDVRHDEMVILRRVPFWSLCEHHLLPFRGHATVAYLPGDRVVGVSKLARLVECHAHRLQVQERMTQDIAQDLVKYLECDGAACLVEATHTCMAMRGVEVEAAMLTSCLLGPFKDNAATRAEFLDLAGRP